MYLHRLTRYQRYHANVAAIKQFYRDISVTVDGEGPAGTAFKDNVSRVSRELFQGIDNQRYGSPKIIIAGAPGGGKGTQCEFIARTYGVVHISTGDILREQVKNGTALGKEAKEYMSKGALVPDHVVIGMVKAKLSEPEVKAKGWLLDGFPRTAAQAKAMADIGIKADAFVQLEVPDSVLVERICLRRTDPVTGKIYHLKFNPPPADVVSRLVRPTSRPFSFFELNRFLLYLFVPLRACRFTAPTTMRSR
jgi:adenylate kinase